MPSTNNRSPLKWAGGKSKLLDTIFDNVPADVEKKRFVDVFSGSGIVGANAAERGFAKVWLNDFNSDLVNLYKCLKSNPARLYQMLKKVLTAENSNERRYYELRTEFNSKVGGRFHRAALFIYLNKNCFNGLCRYNQNGEFNCSYGHPSKPRTLDQSILMAFGVAIKHAEVTNLGFQSVLNECGAGDVVYCDPPYSPLQGINEAKAFTTYVAGEFGQQQHEELVKLAIQAAERGAVVLISNHATNATRELYADASISEFSVGRSISAKSDGRKKVSELIAIYLPRLQEDLSSVS